MQKIDVKWIIILVALVGLSFWLNRGRFQKESMVINPSLRPSRRADATVYSVFFSLNDDFKLTSLKVIPYKDGKFDPLGAPVWNLTSDSNSVPTRGFPYGRPIQGMKPAIKGVNAQPLQTNVNYKISAGGGRHQRLGRFPHQPGGLAVSVTALRRPCSCGIAGRYTRGSRAKRIGTPSSNPHARR